MKRIKMDEDDVEFAQEFSAVKKNVFGEDMYFWFRFSSLVSAKEAKLANGLVKGHAYTITKLVNFDLNGKETKLLRIRNP